ncbi:MAG TPA: redoxin domain-containing protein [Sedimentisphaerales bacterium]|nr:redoxin domain-containing protein [Sedimentisphaerales bacterium]HRS11943.1 redoxin domain-containing protein [Sedimentisphaerales bacterium]HRV49769.1 redoxin domain-containing protein [Sedimentisphaerales bacterium]
MCRVISRFIVLAAILVLMAVPAWGAEEIKTLAIGARAPDFALPGVDGKVHKLSDYDQAKVLVIVFTCNHCPTAQAYEGRIKKLAADYKDKGVALVAISPNDPEAVRLDELGYTDVGDSLEDMKIRAKAAQFNFPYLYDGLDQKVSKAYGPVTTPHVFVFDSGRKLRFAGRVDNNERDPNKATSHDTRDAIEAVLTGRPVAVETTKTMGCSIKWASKRDSVRQAFETWAKEPVGIEEIDLEGVRKLVKNDSDKLRVINIWSTACGPCMVEFPEFVTMNRMYRGREFEMVAVNVDPASRNDKVLAFLKDKQASFKNYHFTSDDIYPFIEAVDKDWLGAIPYTLLVRPGGQIIYRHMGLIDPLEVKRAVVEYLGRTYR